MHVVRHICLWLMVLPAISVQAQQVGQPLPVWQSGQLDIHQINTGQGNATFIVFPDGTSLLVDAGAINPVDWRTNKPRAIPVKPNSERQAGEWIARYVRNALRFQTNPVIDYALITHFHDDHMGSPLHVAKQSAGGYVLTGITEVGEYIPIRKVLDRGWPDYSYPRPLTSDSMVANYRHFLTWQMQHNGLQAEAFQAGRSDQIKLLHQPQSGKGQSDTFEVRNLAVNGSIWTGTGDETRPLFPALSSLKLNDYPTENMCSIALRVRYGRFSYFLGGDIPGVLQFGSPAWHDVETPLAKVVGPVDVQLLDHHGYADSQNGALLDALRPRVFVIPAWADSHPGPDVLNRLYSEHGYAGEREVFATTLLETAKQANADWLPRLKSQSGHVIIRVEKGGRQYRVFVVDDTNELTIVKGIFGPYTRR